LNQENLKEVIKKVIHGESKYSHYQIANWCSNYVNYFEDFEVLPLYLTLSEEIDNQWELYLLNSFSQEELVSIKINEITMPISWFQEWDRKLNCR